MFVNDKGDENKLKEVNLSWCNIADIGDMVYDHFDIINGARSKLKYMLRSSSTGFSMLPNKFTLSDVQRLYENVMEEYFDKRNFRKKFLK